MKVLAFTVTATRPEFRRVLDLLGRISAAPTDLWDGENLTKLPGPFAEFIVGPAEEGDLSPAEAAAEGSAIRVRASAVLDELSGALFINGHYGDEFEWDFDFSEAEPHWAEGSESAYSDLMANYD